MSSSNAFLKEVIFFYFFFYWRFDDIDVVSASKYFAGKHQILTTMNFSGSRVIHIDCDSFVSSPSISLTFIVHLKSIWKLKAGSVPDVKVVSANADIILVAINKRSNTNINEGN